MKDECKNPHPDGGIEIGEHKFDKDGFCIYCGNTRTAFNNGIKNESSGSQFEPLVIPPALFTDNDIDAAYLLGVFNTGGIDKLGSEIARLKELGKMPHEFIFLLKQAV
jgi:hypothetical protein